MILEIKINREDFVGYIEEKVFQYGIEDIEDREEFDSYCTSCLGEMLVNGDYAVVNKKEIVDITLEFLQEKINKKLENLKKICKEEEE